MSKRKRKRRKRMYLIDISFFFVCLFVIFINIISINLTCKQGLFEDCSQIHYLHLTDVKYM